MGRTSGGGIIFGVVLFGIVGLGLMLVGWWGVRRGVEVSVIPSWDAKNIERRARTMRRGSMACLGLGALFVVLAVVSGVSPHPLPHPPSHSPSHP